MEVFLDYIVYILSVNIIQLYFCVKKIKVYIIAILSITLQVIAINFSSVFRRKLVTVLF